MIKRLLTGVVFSLTCIFAYGQTSNFSGNGLWSNPANWSNGIPNQTTNVTTSVGSVIQVDDSAVCNNLTLFLSSLIILEAGKLTIYGDYAATTQGVNNNRGKLFLRGSLKSALNLKALTINGGIEINGGLTFPTFIID